MKGTRAAVLSLLRSAAWAAVAFAGFAPYWLLKGEARALLPSLACLAVPVLTITAVGTAVPVRRAAGLASRRAFLFVFAVVGLSATAGAAAVAETAAARSTWAGTGFAVLWGGVLLAAARLDEPVDLPPGRTSGLSR